MQFLIPYFVFVTSHCSKYVCQRFNNHPITIVRANDKYTNAATIYTHTYTHTRNDVIKIEHK